MPTPTDTQPATAVVASEPDKNELVSVFNKNPPGGDFVHHVYEDVKAEDGRVVGKKPKLEWRAVARDFSNVPRWLANLWKKQAPGVIVDGNQVSKGRAAAPANNEIVNSLRGANEELKKRLDNMQAMIDELNKQRAADGG